MGITIVVPATSILEVLNQPVLTELRATLLAQHNAEKAGKGEE
jgi:hypothetical protein